MTFWHKSPELVRLSEPFWHNRRLLLAGPLAVDHDSQHWTGVMNQWFIRITSSLVGNQDEIGKGAFGKLTQLPSFTQRASPIESGEAEEAFGRYAWVGFRHGLHFGEKVELDGLASIGAGGRQAVGAQADVNAGAPERFERERLVAKVSMAAGAMDDAGLSAGEQGGVAVSQVIDVDGQQIGTKQVLACEVLDG